MKHALVRDGIVENLIELDPANLVDVAPTQTIDPWTREITRTPGRVAWQPAEGLTVHPAEGLAVEIGWQWNDGAPTAPAVPPEIALAEARARVLGEIAAATGAALAAGLALGGAIYQIDEVSQGRILARALFARACLDGHDVWPTDYGWIAADNTRPTFTAEQFWDFANQAQARVTAITLNARALKDAALAAADLAALGAIDVGSGW